jgi:hypothetical protein
MTLDSGRVLTYTLSGPLVPGFPDYRVFMLDLAGPVRAARLLTARRWSRREKAPRRNREHAVLERFPPKRCLEYAEIERPRSTGA